MTGNEIQDALWKLGQAFGGFKPERATFYKEYLERVDHPDLLLKAIDNIILTKTDRYYPTIGEIKEEYNCLARVSNMSASLPVYCSICGGTGIIIRRIQTTQFDSDTAFRCECPNGMKLKRFVPISEAPEDAAHQYPRNLRTEKYEDVLLDSRETFRGVVEFKCVKCGNPYFQEYGEQTKKDFIEECHERGLKLCDKCYIEVGREKGFWL